MPASTLHCSSDDLSDFLRWIMLEDEPHIYEANSRPGQELVRFTSASEVIAYLQQWFLGGDRFLSLGLHFPSTKGLVSSERIEFTHPTARQMGAEFRYDLRGWGIFWLQLERQPDGYFDLLISVNSKKRALDWVDTYRDLGDPALWDWDEVSRLQRRVSRKARSMCMRSSFAPSPV